MDQQPYVASIAENSPLRVCGVKQGDAIVKWAEHVITNRDTLIRVYKQAKYDQAITLVVCDPRVLASSGRANARSGAEFFKFCDPGGCGSRMSSLQGGGRASGFPAGGRFSSLFGAKLFFLDPQN